MDDILLAFKATGTLRKSVGDGSAMGYGLLASRLHTVRSSLDGDALGAGGEARSKGDRVAEILSRVRTLTKKLDKTSSLSSPTATPTPTLTPIQSASSPLIGSPTAPSSSSSGGFGDYKHDVMGDSRDEAVWSLVNPMHASPKGRAAAVPLGMKGKARGEDRGAVLKISKPHRYGNASGIEEETKSDEGDEKKQDDRGSSSSSRNRQQVEVEVEGGKGRSRGRDNDEKGGPDSDVKATATQKSK